VDTILKGEADFVIGSRYVAGGTTEQDWGIFRWVNSKVATIFARFFTKALDPMSGFFALSREQFSNADTLNPVGYKIGLELLVKCRCRRVRELPIHFANRMRGESKLSLREQWLYIKHIKRLADYRFGWLSHFSQFCFVGCTGLVVDLSIYTVLLWLTTGYPAGLYISRAMAIAVAMTWNFWLNRRFTFSYSRHGNVISQYMRFATTCSVGAAVSWSISVGLVKIVPFFSQHVLIAAVLGIAGGTFSNFFMSRHWAFAKPTATVNREKFT
jgi:dolichol-phosphate mannosyltransferase